MGNKGCSFVEFLEKKDTNIDTVFHTLHVSNFQYNNAYELAKYWHVSDIELFFTANSFSTFDLFASTLRDFYNQEYNIVLVFDCIWTKLHVV